MRAAGLIALILVIILSIAILLVSFSVNPILGDEGVVAMDGMRIAGGQVPHRDFFQFIPPLSGYVQALFFKLLSPSVLSVRAVGLIYGILLVVLSFFLYRNFIKDIWVLAALLSIFIKYGVAPWYYGSHHWLCDVLQLAGAMLLLRALNRNSNFLSALSGACLGLAAFSLQDQGVYAVLGILLAGIFSREKKIFIYCACSAVMTFLVLALPFALVAGPGQLIKDWVLFAVLQYKAPAGHQFSFAYYFGTFAQAVGTDNFRFSPFYTSSIFAAAVFVILSPLLCPASLVFISIRKLFSKNEFVVLTVFSLSFLLGAFHRLAMTNLSWAFPMALLPVFIVIDSFASSRQKPLMIFSRTVSITLMIAMMMFAGIRISWLTGERARLIETPRGIYKTLNAADARDIRELLGAINQNVGEGEPLFVAGYVPLISFMTGHPNPTRFNFMMPGGYYSEEQVSSWLGDLEQKQVKWGVGEKAVVDAEMAGRLLPRYEIAFENRKFMIFKRKEKQE